MDIATEEFGHLEIVGATIQMLLGPVNGEMKNALEDTPLRPMMRAVYKRQLHVFLQQNSRNFIKL